MLFLVGVMGTYLCDHLIRKVMSISIINSAVIVFFVYTGSERGTEAPIMLEGVEDIVDPLPQALMLTAIVVGICLIAVALSLTIGIYNRYGTTSIRKLQRCLRKGNA